jgi:hypothetical protein
MVGAVDLAFKLATLNASADEAKHAAVTADLAMFAALPWASPDLRAIIERVAPLLSLSSWQVEPMSHLPVLARRSPSSRHVFRLS